MPLYYKYDYTYSQTYNPAPTYSTPAHSVPQPAYPTPQPTYVNPQPVYPRPSGSVVAVAPARSLREAAFDLRGSMDHMMGVMHSIGNDNYPTLRRYLQRMN